MKLKKTTIGGMAATLLFAVGCGSGGGGTATGGSGGATGTGNRRQRRRAAAGRAARPAGRRAGQAGSAGAAGGAVGGAGGLAGSAGAGGGVGGTGGVGGGTGGVTIPPALAVPAGATLSLQYHGSGTQIYTCTPSGGAEGGRRGRRGGGAGAGATTYSWVLKGPDAKLYDSTGAQVGTHGIGPEWTSSDGSVVNGPRWSRSPRHR